MQSVLRGRRPSAAMVVALIAVFGATLGGTVYAAGKISGKKIRKNSLPGNRIKKNTVKGKQVKESALGQVPSAANANTVGGVGEQAFHFLVPNGGGDVGETSVFSREGLELVVSCVGADPGFVARSSVNGGQFQFRAIVGPDGQGNAQVVNQQFSDDFDAGEQFDLAATNVFLEQFTGDFLNQETGRGVHFEGALDATVGNVCEINGYAHYG